MAKSYVANICIPKLLLQSNWITGSLPSMVSDAQILPWKGARSIPVTGKRQCHSWVEDREPNQCLHREAVALVPHWAGLPARPWAACSSTCLVLWGESHVLARGMGQSVMSVMRTYQEIWKRDGARPGCDCRGH